MENLGELTFQNSVNLLPPDVHLASKSSTDDYEVNEFVRNDFKLTFANLVVENAKAIDETEVSLGDVIMKQDLTSLDHASFLFATHNETTGPSAPQTDSFSVNDHEDESSALVVPEVSTLHILDGPGITKPISFNSTDVTKMIDPATDINKIDCTQPSTSFSNSKKSKGEVKREANNALIHDYITNVTETEAKCELDDAVKNILSSEHSRSPSGSTKKLKPPDSASTEEVTLKTNLTKRNKEKVQEKHQCNVCGKSFREKSHLATHSRAHVDVRNFSCDVCGSRFKTKANLNIHSQTHSEIPFTCTECNKTFAERKILKRHIRVVHSCKELHKCHQCDKTFKSAAILSQHFTLHTGAKPFQCSMCPKTFVYKSTLAMHISQYHQCNNCLTSPCRHRPRSWFCPVCGKGYSLKATLTNHMKTHDPDNLFKCNKCPKTFVKKQTYEVHIKLHTGEGPQYMCDQCSQSYFNVFALRRHYMKHTSQKKFICEFCSKAFWMKDALKVHMRTHTKEKPFQCPKCPKAFGHKHTLEGHIKTHRVDEEDPQAVVIPATTSSTAYVAPNALAGLPLTTATTAGMVALSHGSTTTIPAQLFVWYQLPPPTHSLTINDHESGELTTLHILDAQDFTEPISLQVSQNPTDITQIIDPVTALNEFDCTQVSNAISSSKTFKVEMKRDANDAFIHGHTRNINEAKPKCEVINAIENILNGVHSR